MEIQRVVYRHNTYGYEEKKMFLIFPQSVKKRKV